MFKATDGTGVLHQRAMKKRVCCINRSSTSRSPAPPPNITRFVGTFVNRSPLQHTAVLIQGHYKRLNSQLAVKFSA